MKLTQASFKAIATLVLSTAPFPALAGSARKATDPVQCINLAFGKMTAKQLHDVLPEFLERHFGPDGKVHYSDILSERKIRDQERYGDCWEFGTKDEIEQRYQARTGRKLHLSDAITIESIRTRAHDGLRNQFTTIEEGGDLPIAEGLIREHGLIPEKAWKPRLDFASREIKDRFMDDLNTRIVNFRERAAREKWTAERIDTEAKLEEKKIDRLIDSYVGPRPKTFHFDGRDWTPHEFADHVLPPEERKFIALSPYIEPLPSSIRAKIKRVEPKHRLRERDTIPLQPERVYKGIDPKNIALMIREEIRAGRSVPLAFLVKDRYVDDKYGIISIAAFKKAPGFQLASRAMAEVTDGMLDGGHLVNIVGVDFDKHGNPVRFLIKNSWGSDHGDHGYYHMYFDYFKNFIMEAHVQKFWDLR